MTTDTIEAPAGFKIAEYNATAAGLAELQKRLKDRAYDLTTTKGDKEARADRQECVKLRTSLEAKRKELKAPALERSRLIDEEAKRINAEILALEGPIDEQIKAAEAKKEQERQARIEAERQRVAAIRERIDAMAAVARRAMGTPAAEIERRLKLLVAITVGDDFAELKPEAERVHAETLQQLREMHAAALAQEAEAKRLADERAELERLRAEQAERERLEFERLAAENAAAEARLAEERAALERERAAARAEQERIDAEAAAARKAADDKARAEREEADRIAAEQRESERQRVDAEVAELRRQQEAAAAEQRRLDEEAAARRRQEAEAAAERQRAEQAAQERVQQAGPVLLAALVIALPHVAQHGTAEELQQCQDALATAGA